MENASKALIMVAGVLIGIMLLSFMLYIFKRFGATSRETDIRLSQRDIESFNARFLSYETGGDHNISDDLSVTYTRGDIKGTIRNEPETVTIKYSDLFKEGAYNTQKDKIYYGKALVAASKTLKTVSDVVSAINDAIDVNDKNNNHYVYSGIEIQNSVEIIIDLNEYATSLPFATVNGVNYRYFVIEPNPNVVARYVYGQNPSSLTDTGNNTEDKVKNIEKCTFSTNNAVKVYDLLRDLRETKSIEDSLKKYTVYEYYFMGEVFTNETTGLIETVKFTLVKDKNF